MNPSKLLLTLLFLLSAPASASCREYLNATALDFWLGEWLVTDSSREEHFGTNRIEMSLNGCVVQEYWQAADGSQGRSLFYYLPDARHWEQIWVTEDVEQFGGLKQKSQVPVVERSGVRFQGTVRFNKKDYLDRTTLMPQPDGTVKQTIELSSDNGESWDIVFDALYTRFDTLDMTK